MMSQWLRLHNLFKFYFKFQVLNTRIIKFKLQKTLNIYAELIMRVKIYEALIVSMI